MPETQVSIANMALSHIGVSQRIATLTERSTLARACLLFYENVREQLLRDFDWPFARRYAALALVETFATDGSREWRYSYRVPGDVLAVRRVQNASGTRYETELTRVAFELAADAQGGLLFTDFSTELPAVLRYTANITDTSRFTPDFTQGFALLLAGHIAPEISRGDELKLGERALAKYAWRIRQAWVNAANESQPMPDQASVFERARG